MQIQLFQGGTYPFNFVWSTGDINSTIIVNDTIYNLNLTVQDLCGLADSFAISINPFVLETEINYDDSLYLAEVNINADLGIYSYLWSNLE